MKKLVICMILVVAMLAGSVAHASYIDQEYNDHVARLYDPIYINEGAIGIINIDGRYNFVMIVWDLNESHIRGCLGLYDGWTPIGARYVMSGPESYEAGHELMAMIGLEGIEEGW